MKTLITTAAIVAALTFPALAEGTTDTKGEASGNVKQSTTSPNQAGATGQNTMGQGKMMAPGAATTGAGRANTNKMAPSESSKSTSGADGGGSGGSGGNGGGGSR